MNHWRQQWGFLGFKKEFKQEVHCVLVLNKTGIKDVSRCAKPGGFQMGPSSGTPSEHIPLKATIPKAADMGSPTVPSAGARNETGVCIKCAEPSPGTLASFSM